MDPTATMPPTVTRPMFTAPANGRLVGLQLPVQALTSYLAEPWEHDAGPPEMARVAGVADRAGYDYIGVCDHVALPEAAAASMSTQWVDPVSTLGWLAASTERVRLLTHVYVLPYRNPLIAAKQFATLDWLSGGRLVCGIGAGHVEAEFAHLGADFAGRGATVTRGVARRAALLEHEWVDGFGARPRPVQSPRPPIWIAGSTPAAIRRAARSADGWLPQSPTSQEMVDLLVATRDASDRAGQPVVIGHIAPPIYLGEPTWDVGPRTLVGRPGDLAEQLIAGAPGAVNQIQIRFRARTCDELCDQLQAFADHGLAQLRSR